MKRHWNYLRNPDLEFDRPVPIEYRRKIQNTEAGILDSFCFYGVNFELKDISKKRYKQLLKEVKNCG